MVPKLLSYKHTTVQDSFKFISWCDCSFLNDCVTLFCVIRTKGHQTVNYSKLNVLIQSEYWTGNIKYKLTDFYIILLVKCVQYDLINGCPDCPTILINY